MRTATIVPATLAVLWLGAAGASGQGCEPDGDVQFLCGPVSPEDLAPIPESPWIVVSSMVDEGHLYLADTRDHSSTAVFPTATSRPQHDANHTLYVVGHGAREAIEVFDVDVSGDTPRLTWVGCAVAPDPLGLNSVVALPGGGFAATSPRTGDIWEWSTDTAWSRVAGSEDIGPNGLEISRDGQWFYVGGYGEKSLIRLSRGQTPVQTDAVEVGFHIDNVRWGPGETLFAAGHLGPTREAIGECFRDQQCDGVVSRVAQIDLPSFTAKQLVRYPSNDQFILGTVAIQVGDEIWVGGVAGSNRIARFRTPAR